MTYPTLRAIEEASESYAGWCTNCEEWTHDSCEPDARKYTCPECDQPTCYGAEEMAIMGWVSDDDDEEFDSCIDESDE